MTKTETFYRRANVSKTQAIEALLSRFPKADLTSFETKKATAQEAAANGLQPGELIFAATIKHSEFPPKDDEGGESEETEDEPADEAPEKPEPADDDDSGDSDSSGPSEKPEFGGGKPKKMNPQEEMVHLLQEILHALQGGAGPDAGPDLGPGAGPDVPDIGAPGQGEGLPGAKAPLPPPVKPKAPIGMGGPAFSHYDSSASEFTTIRVNANEKGNRALIAEAAEAYPTHKVAKIQRTGSAVLNGKRYNLPENNIAVVTFVKA